MTANGHHPLEPTFILSFEAYSQEQPTQQGSESLLLNDGFNQAKKQAIATDSPFHIHDQILNPVVHQVTSWMMHVFVPSSFQVKHLMNVHSFRPWNTFFFVTSCVFLDVAVAD